MTKSQIYLKMQAIGREVEIAEGNLWEHQNHCSNLIDDLRALHTQELYLKFLFRHHPNKENNMDIQPVLNQLLHKRNLLTSAIQALSDYTDAPRKRGRPPRHVEQVLRSYGDSLVTLKAATGQAAVKRTMSPAARAKIAASAKARWKKAKRQGKSHL